MRVPVEHVARLRAMIGPDRAGSVHEPTQSSAFDGFLDCIIIESLHNPIADA
jgi:hypothetical protein